MTNHAIHAVDLGSKTTRCATDHRSTVFATFAAAAAPPAAVGILGCGVVWYDLQLKFWFFPESLLESLDDVNSCLVARFHQYFFRQSNSVCTAPILPSWLDNGGPPELIRPYV